MVVHVCEKCGKEFSQKGNYRRHINKKNSCVSVSENPNPTTIKSDDDTIVEPFYKIETSDYTIINSCCIEGLTNMKNKQQKIQLTVTSPPFFNARDYVIYTDYEEYLQTLKTVFSLVYEITEEGRMCCVNLSNILVKRKNRNSESSRIPLAFHFVPLMEEIGWKFIEDIIWIKPEGAVKNRNGGFFQHRQPVAYKPNVINEYIFVFQKPSSFLIDKIVRNYDAITSLNSKVDDNYERTNVWRINPETKSEHPAPYPELLVDRLIKYYSFCGDLVLDPFIGSGTTAISAFRLNRKSIGFEIHKEYISMFEDRIKKVQKEMSIKTEISICKDDYINLPEEQIKQKINKFSRKHLYQLVNNDKNYSSYSKKKLVDIIYTLCFVNTT